MTLQNESQENEAKEALKGLKRETLPPVTDYLSTGCTILDLAIADQLPGGFGGGRISHIYGSESTAKTVLAQEPLGAVQRAGGFAYFADIEHSLDLERANLFGMKIDESFEYSSPSNIEELFDDLIAGILKDRDEDSESAALAVDSLSALPSKKELEKGLDDVGYGTVRAKQLSAAFRKYIDPLARKNLALIFIDQSRIDITKIFGDKETVSGGRALRFYASTRVQVTHKGKIKNKHKKVIGVEIGFKVVKNKIGPPFREGTFDLLFDIGIDDIVTNLKWLRENSGKPTQKTPILCPDGKTFRGYETAASHIEDNDLEDELQQMVYERWREVYAPIQRKKRKR